MARENAIADRRCRRRVVCALLLRLLKTEARSKKKGEKCKCESEINFAVIDLIN